MLTKWGEQPHHYSKWGVYQIITKNGKIVGDRAVCLIPDNHIDPHATGEAIIKALNKAGIMPIIDETL